MKKIAVILAALLMRTLSAAIAENQYYSVATPVEITAAETYTMDGLQDELIDSNAAVVELLEGDGYKTSEVEMGEGVLSAQWKDGGADYTMGSLKGVFSPQGGDGNGHFDFRIGVSGLTYNGLPLSDAIIRTGFYSFGRTFSVTGDQVRVVLTSRYGDELALESVKDYTVASDVTSTTVTLDYICWAYAPVYTTLTVEIDTSVFAYDERMYAPTPTFLTPVTSRACTSTLS